MILTHLVLFSFFDGASPSDAPTVTVKIGLHNIEVGAVVGLHHIEFGV